MEGDVAHNESGDMWGSGLRLSRTCEDLDYASPEFCVSCSVGFRVARSVRVARLAFSVWAKWLRISELGLRIMGLGLRIWRLGFRMPKPETVWALGRPNPEFFGVSGAAPVTRK